MPLYEVVGLGRETNRKRTSRYKARDEAHARLLAESEGTIPETVTLVVAGPASERQIKYAVDLGLVIPKDVTSAQIGDLINRKLEDDDPSPASLLQLAREQFPEEAGVAFTEFVGFRHLLGFLGRQYVQRDNTIGLVKLFVYAVINELTDSTWRTPFSQLADDPDIQAVVTELSQDPKVVASIKKYPFESLVAFGQQTDSEGYHSKGASRRTIAFQAASRLLTERGIIPGKAAPTQIPRSPSSTPKEANQKSGCLPVLFVLLCLSGVLIAVASAAIAPLAP